MPFPPLHLWPQRLALASAILLAAGCVTSEGLEPNARLQPAGALQAGRSLEGVALSPAAWPRQDWWTGLGDRQLDQLIGEALQGTPDLQIAEARARQAAATAQAQDAARQPTLDAKASYSGIRAPTSVAPAPLGGRYSAIKYLSLGFNYDFDLWGGERAAWEAALGQANAARIDSQAARIGLSASIARAYSDLAVLLGKGPDRGLELQRPQPLNPASLSLPSVLPAELLGRRADIVAARWRVEAARRNIDSAKTEFYPNLNLGAMAGLAALHTSDVLQAPSRFFQVAPAISLPIFDGGRRRANLAERDADYDLAVGQYNKTLVQALGEVIDNLGKLRSLEQQVIDQRQARDIARSNFDLAMRRYGEGVGSYLDALSVQQQLLVAERQLASLESQQIDLSVQLVQALGGGFQPDSRSAALATAKAPAE
ncbi:efflux transporter outer membrane subunit [Pseudomonas aeruginosa]|uniref:efflux transporter outer membrane subunit n=1 Tax=Pseudomonas aeruginosa TaxID=287 RepID=UPI00157F8BB2|nr:efflux transporter outer membrane subunit [Pseudomonas aeruginosa]MBG7139193.1 efflux transporter outer membrane subunit [Pseudomonas aeruginosa]QKR18508.1 efflux transporter outer membrane subunit [Pseudomonas aeruginosa]